MILGPSLATIVSAVEVTTAVNRRELQRYLARVGDRWPIDVAVLGGARVADEQGAPPQRERGPEFIVILVSPAFEGMPWLERVYTAGSLWDVLRDRRLSPHIEVIGGVLEDECANLLREFFEHLRDT